MAAKQEVNIPQLFSEISKFFKNGDYALAQKSANKILKVIPNDVDALKCKIVCLIQQSCFQEAHDVIASNEKKGLFKVPFEKAYCLYRLNRLFESKEILESIEEPSLKDKELLAQVNYRLEDYKSCLDLYRDLVKNSADDYGDEREANMAAVVAAAKMWKKETLSHSNIRTDTYELCYNYACLMLAQGNMKKAEEILNDATALCRKSFDGEEDVTEEEIDEELGVIRAQLAYIHQLQNKTTDALNAYNQVIKTKPSDIALVAVISNNVIAINKEKGTSQDVDVKNQERDLFDSKKRLKSLSVPGLENKLTLCQQQFIELNKCMLYIYTNQIENCRKSIKTIKSKFTSLEGNKTALLESALYLKDKHPDQAVEHLKSLVSSGVRSNDVILTLCQLYMSKGKYEDALKILEQLQDIKYKPAVVSLRVSLYTTLNQREDAIKCLDDAADYGRTEQEFVSKDDVVTYMRESSNLKLAAGDVKSAVQTLEQLRKENPSDITTLAKIVAAYSKFDLKKAQHHSVDLPEFNNEALNSKEIDLDVLEMTDMIGSFRFSKKTTKNATDEGGETKEEITLKKKKQRKRKKGKLPKNYNPDVDPDPERWLPRWERSTFKHKKTKRGANTNIGKGTQGSVSTDQPASPKPNSVSSPKPAVSGTSPQNSPGGANVIPPRQQKPGAKSKSKKKKKGGGW